MHTLPLAITQSNGKVHTSVPQPAHYLPYYYPPSSHPCLQTFSRAVSYKVSIERRAHSTAPRRLVPRVLSDCVKFLPRTSSLPSKRFAHCLSAERQQASLSVSTPGLRSTDLNITGWVVGEGERKRDCGSGVWMWW